MKLGKKFAIWALALSFLSCGIPSYTVLSPPDPENTGDTQSLGFELSEDHVDDETRYILFYKFYWPGEDDISDDKDVFDDEDTLSTGSSAPKSLGFIQFATSKAEDASSSYPYDSSDLTLTGSVSDSGIDVILDFDPTDSTPDTVTMEYNDGSAATASLYRRVREKDNGSYTGNVFGKDFFTADYDYRDTVDFTDGVETVTADTDGMDADLTGLFSLARFYSSNYELQSLTVAVVVYATTYDVTTGGGIESIPVYLGTVDFTADYWYTANP